MAILKLPAKNYLECVDRLERAFMQVGMFRHHNIGKHDGFIEVYIEEDFEHLTEDVKKIYHSYERPSA